MLFSSIFSFICSIFPFRSVISCLATFHVSFRSTPKYSWIRMSLIPAILFHGMCGCFSFSSSGMFFGGFSDDFDSSYYGVLNLA